MLDIRRLLISVLLVFLISVPISIIMIVIYESILDASQRLFQETYPPDGAGISLGIFFVIMIVLGALLLIFEYYVHKPKNLVELSGVGHHFAFGTAVLAILASSTVSFATGDAIIIRFFHFSSGIQTNEVSEAIPFGISFLVATLTVFIVAKRRHKL